MNVEYNLKYNNHHSISREQLVVADSTSPMGEHEQPNGAIAVFRPSNYVVTAAVRAVAFELSDGTDYAYSPRYFVPPRLS